MSLFSTSEQAGMILHAKRWGLERLARQADVSARHIYKILYGKPGKRGGPPKGADVIDRLFRDHYVDPVAPPLRPLADTINRILRLTRDKQNCAEELATMIADWVRAFEFFAPREQADDEEVFLVRALRGHVFFAAAHHVAVAKNHPLTEVFVEHRKAEYARRSVEAFQRALRDYGPAKQPYHKAQRYKLFWAKTVANFGAAVFMAWTKGLMPNLRLQDVKAIFDAPEHRITDALEFLYEADPRNPRVPFNMLCWCSVLQDVEGCRVWWQRLTEKHPLFCDTDKVHSWMNKPISQDADFKFLMELLKSGTLPTSNKE